VYGIASKLNGAIAPFANNLVWVRASLGALFASGLGLAILVALVTGQTLDAADDGGPATRFANSLSRGGSDHLSKGLPGGAHATTNGAAVIDARDLHQAIDELTATELTDGGSAEPNADSKTAGLSTTAPDATRPLVEETSSIAIDNSDKSGGPRKHVQRGGKSISQRESSIKYHQVPKGTEKMFDANWQSKAFAFE